MSRKKVESSEKEVCKMSKASKIVGDFWSIMIVRELSSGCKRFGELEEAITDITTATLSSRLKSLDSDGIIERKQYDCIPPKVEYTLTEKGNALKKVIKDIELFGENWM